MQPTTESTTTQPSFFRVQTSEAENEFSDLIASFRKENEFLNTLGSWIDTNRIPLAKVEEFLTNFEILNLLPLLNYIDLRNFTLIHDSSNWKNEDLNPISILQIISQKENLEELNLCDFPLPPAHQISMKGVNLKSLDISKISDINPSFVKDLGSLLRLAIHCQYMKNEGLEEIAEGCNQLQELDATFHEELKTHDLTSFGKLKNLTSLTLRDLFCLKNEDFQFVEELPNLTEVCFDRCFNITSEVASKLESLKFLKMKSCAPIKEGSLESLANTSIETLILENSYEYDKASMMPVGTANLNTLLPLAQIKTLKHLHLKNCSNLTFAEQQTLRQELAHLETFTIE